MNLALRAFLLHGGLVAALVLAHFALPEYHQGNLARIMVLAVFAMGYNLLFGYTGLLSLGHAMFFSAGLYGAGLLIGLSDGIISVFFSPTLAKIIATMAVALVLVFRPQGLFGVSTR